MARWRSAWPFIKSSRLQPLWHGTISRYNNLSDHNNRSISIQDRLCYYTKTGIEGHSKLAGGAAHLDEQGMDELLFGMGNTIRFSLLPVKTTPRPFLLVRRPTTCESACARTSTQESHAADNSIEVRAGSTISRAFNTRFHSL